MKRNKVINTVDFKEFVANDVNNQKGIFHPVKASFLERLLVKKVSCKRLHPNASDEFTFQTLALATGLSLNTKRISGIIFQKASGI